MRCSLVFIDYCLESIYRRQVIPAPQIVAADHHFLSSQMVVTKVDLEASIPRVLAVGVAVDQLLEDLLRLLRHLLVAVNIGDLLIVAEAL
jgi:hypothetical protein